MTKKKILIIVFSILSGLLAIGGIVIAFLYNYDNSAPSAVESFDDGENVMLKVSQNENYAGYRFKFVLNEEEIIFDSKTNVIYASEVDGLVVGNRYNVSACYRGESEGSNSSYSKEINWTYYAVLSSPQVEYDEEENSIIWESVANADYYQVYYTGTDKGSVRVEEPSFSLEGLTGGVREFVVVAHSLQDYLMASKASEPVTCEYVRHFKPFLSAQFDKESLTLTVTGQERLDYIILQVDGQTVTVNDFRLFEEDGLFTYQFSVKPVYKVGVTFTVSPPSIDEYNIYTGEPLVV